MGNCALKPKVMLEFGAPAPEELKDSLLEYQKIETAISLSSLFLQDSTEKKIKDDEKITPENMPIAQDLKTAFVDDKSPTKETISSVMETKAPADDHKVVTPTVKVADEVVREERVIDVVTVKESESKAKAAEVGAETDTMKETSNAIVAFLIAKRLF